MAREDFTAGERSTGRRHTVRRSTETKAAFKTTELIAYVAAVIRVLIAAAIVDESDAGGRRAAGVPYDADDDR